MNAYGPRPKSVHEIDGVHYFYWRWDAYKPFDYEPVMLHESAKIVVLSRFHWHVATIWTHPIVRDGRPSVTFVKGTHTPIVESDSYEWRYVEIETGIPLRERISLTIFYLPAFNEILTRRMFRFAQDYDYSERLTQGGVPQKYFFELEEIRAAVVIGKMFKPNDVPTVIKEKLWGKEGSGKPASGSF